MSVRYDRNGDSDWGYVSNYVYGTGWAVVVDEHRPGVKLDRTIDELDWLFMFYLIYKVTYLW